MKQVKEPRSDYIKGYKAAMLKAYDWLNTLDDFYIGYDIGGNPYLDVKLLRKNFKSMIA